MARRTTTAGTPESGPDRDALALLFRHGAAAASITRLADGKTLDVNEAYVEVTGFRADQAVGRTAIELGLWCDPREREAFVEQLRPSGCFRNLECRFRRADGTLRTASVSAQVGSLAGEAVIVASFFDVSESKEARDSLQRSLETFSKAFHHNVAGMCITRLDDGTYLEINDAMLRMLGSSREEVVGRTPAELKTWFGPAEREAYVRKLLERGSVENVERRFRRSNGEPWTALMSSQLVELDGERVVVTSALDITDRTRTEERLRESEAELRRLLETAHEGIWMLDLEGVTRYVNPRMAEMLGRTPDEMLGRSAFEFVWPEDLAAGQAEWEARKGEAGGRGTVFRYLHASGEPVWCQVSVSPALDAAGRQTGTVGMFTDVTESRRSHEALRESEARLRTVIENSADGINLLDLKTGRYTLMSPAQVAMTGFTAEEILNISAEEAYERVHPEDREISVLQQRSVTAGLDSSTAEYRWKVKSGEYRWFSDRRRLVRDERGEPVALVGVSRDITERKQVEEALRASQQQLAVALRAAQVGIFQFEVDSGEVHWDARMREMWEVPPDERITFEAFLGGVHPEDQAMVRAAVAAALDPAGDPAPAAEYRVVGRRTGRIRWVTGTGVVQFAGGRPVRLIGAAQDVTERKRIELDLREADRQKNEFLAVLSHELRNPLAPILSSVFVLRHAPAGGAQAAHAQDVIDRQARQLSRLVDDLLEITRITQGKIRLEREVVDVAAVLRRTAEDYRAKFETAKVALRIETQGAPVWVDADPARLTQVIGNLLSNAAKFTPEGGSATASLRAERGTAELRVRDDGVGIAAEFLPRVFEPFAQAENTLDRTRGGLGLGLPVLKGIVELHGGSVEVHSEGHGRGAEFVVRLPLAHPPGPADAERAGAETRPRRVLVVEDNEDAAETLKTVLELQGHSVQVAHTGWLAIEAATRMRPDVVLCDIGLPGLDGFEVARRLRAIPELRGAKLVALSGYALPEDVAATRAAGFDAHLAKPVDPEQLADL